MKKNEKSGKGTHRLSTRIERRLQGLPDPPKPTQKRANVPPDSDRPLSRETRVDNYKSDDKTRGSFKAHIGPVRSGGVYGTRTRRYTPSSSPVLPGLLLSSL